MRYCILRKICYDELQYEMHREVEGVFAMDKWLIERLQEITPEEQAYLDGNVFVKKDIYTTKDVFEIDYKLFLQQGRLVTVRHHSRFVAFPPHRHNYIEMMYVCCGTITHEIDGKELVLNKGDMLFLNPLVRHSVRRAEFGDIGINFIALPEFFELPCRMLGKQNVLIDFFTGILGQTASTPQYLLFQLRDQRPIENLMENMIASIVRENQNEDVINQYSMGLVFLYLMNHMDSLMDNSSQSYRDVLIQATLKYIDTQYKTASLTHIAEDFGQSASVFSRMIKQSTGFTFQELLIRKRCQKAVMYLVETDVPIEKIVSRIGYENQNHFYRQFKKWYGMTPGEYRAAHKTDERIRI